MSGLRELTLSGLKAAQPDALADGLAGMSALQALTLQGAFTSAAVRAPNLTPVLCYCMLWVLQTQKRFAAEQAVLSRVAMRCAPA